MRKKYDCKIMKTILKLSVLALLAAAVWVIGVITYGYFHPEYEMGRTK